VFSGVSSKILKDFGRTWMNLAGFLLQINHNAIFVQSQSFSVVYPLKFSSLFLDIFHKTLQRFLIYMTGKAL